MLIDRYGRKLINARFAITLRCNYRCFFCHREGGNAFSDELKPEEVGIIAEALARVGVRKFKITGGEPLLRKDVAEVVREVDRWGMAEDISMTTNGYYLREFISGLVDAGLRRVNISLHTLREGVYEFIVGVNGLGKVIEGIKEVLRYPLTKVKVNAVILRGVNDAEVWDIINFAEGLGVHVQLIELHPVGRGKDAFNTYYTPLDDVVKRLNEICSRVIIRGDLHNRPIYELPSGITVEVVRPVLNPIFCAGCSRIRVMPDGSLMPCLNSSTAIPTVDVVRGNDGREEKVRKIVDTIIEVNKLRKPSSLWPIRDDVDREYMRIKKLGNFTKEFRLKFSN